MTSAPVTSPHPIPRPPGEFPRTLLDLPDRAVAALAQSPFATLLMLAAALVVAVLLWRVARCGMRARSGRNRAVEKPCTWYVGSMRMASGAQKWHCQTCGRDGFSTSAAPPTGCNWAETTRPGGVSI